MVADLTRVISNSHDWDELVWAWRGWRDVTGKGVAGMKANYTKFVSLQNKAARMNGSVGAGCNQRERGEGRPWWGGVP